MRLWQKLALALLAMAVLPPSILGVALLRSSEQALVEAVHARQALAAEAAAATLQGRLTEAAQVLGRTAAGLPVAALGPAEREGALRLAAVTVAGARAAALIGEDGRARARSQPDERAAAALLGSVRPGPEAGAVRLLELPSGGAVALAADLVGEAGERWTLALELPVAPFVPAGARLVDADGALRAGPAPGTEAVLVGAAEVELPGLQWRVEVETPAAEALAPIARMRRTILGVVGLSLLLLVVGTALVSRSIQRRIGQVEAGATAVGRGELAHRLPEEGEDELAALARTMNRVGAELAAARARLQGWNAELQAEVERRTAELRVTEQRLAEASRLAAVGQLGAGVAHELNNPLAGILGNTQLLLARGGLTEGARRALQEVEQLSRRCTAITRGMLRLSEAGLRSAPATVELRAVLGPLAVTTDGVALHLAELPDGMTVTVDPLALRDVLVELVANARTATAAGGPPIELRASREGGAVIIEVADRGAGIAPEDLPRLFEPFFTRKRSWQSVGLGLPIARRLAEVAGGTITIAARDGGGVVATLRLLEA